MKANGYAKKIRNLPKRYKRGFLALMDGRELITKRLQGAFNAIVADTGGAESQTHLRLALIERAVFLEFALQRWEAALLAGKTDDATISRWIQAVNSLLGLAKTLGLNRSRLENALDVLYGPVEEPDPKESPAITPTPLSNTADGQEGEKVPRRRERLSDALSDPVGGNDNATL